MRLAIELHLQQGLLEARHRFARAARPHPPRRLLPLPACPRIDGLQCEPARREISRRSPDGQPLSV
jgi:hypothetical protein